MKKRFLLAYLLVLTMFTTYVLMDTFVITRVYGEAETAASEDAQNEVADSSADAEQSGEESSRGPGDGHGPGSGSHGRHSSGSDTSGNASGSSSLTTGSSVTADSYKDSNISITLTEYRENDTTIYVADVQVSSPEYLKTALAGGLYGKNVTAETSETAESVNAILAINGDYYGARENGYVIRNGKLYRSTSAGDKTDLVIYKDGSWGLINESTTTAEQLISSGAVQTLSFGPALIENGSIAVGVNTEVGKAMASNPRTALGIIDDCHYVFVVSDGRTDESAGLSLYQLAEFMDSLGVTTAYNLDGGGSSTMYFNGQIVNNPTSGRSIKERSVSDIVYIGY